MNKKTKNLLKVGVVALALLLCLSLAIGLTGAWYKASRTASGTLALNQGIIIDYEGFGKETPGIWQKEETTTFKLFSDISAEPGKEITLNTSAIRANKDSTKFFARVKLDYAFYGADNGEITLENAESLIKSNGNIFGADWVQSQVNTEYFYYANPTNKELKVFEKSNQTFVNIFVNGAKLVIESENFTGEGPGFETENGTITRIEILLTLETLQGDLTAAEENKWYILPPPVIEDFSTNRLTDASGNKMYTLAENQDIALDESTTYQVVDNSGNGYKFTYALNEQEKTATITGYVGQPTELEIPDYIKVNGDMYKVTSIGDSAFRNCSYLQSITIANSVIKIGKQVFSACKNLTLITIPDSVTRIEEYSFYSCSSLTSIDIPDSVTLIGSSAFSSCSNLTSIEIPNSVTTIGSNAFENCSKLISIIIPNSVTNLGSYAFSGCSNLTSIEISDRITIIWNYTFSGCSKLISITIPDKVTSIERDAFSNCSKLETVTIGSGVTKLGSRAFYGCRKLATITIPDRITIIGDSAFENCSGLTTVTIGNGVTRLGSRVFSGCSELTTITIPNSVTNIGNNAFADCSKLDSINIPNKITRIESSVFANCSGLTSIMIPDSVTSIGDMAFSNCSGLTTITIPDSLTSIGNWAFDGCSGLTTITIPDSVTSIGSWAFDGCSGLTTITFERTTPPTLGGSSIPSNVTKIKVPQNATTVYRDALTSYDATWGASVEIEEIAE